MPAGKAGYESGHIPKTAAHNKPQTLSSLAKRPSNCKYGPLFRLAGSKCRRIPQRRKAALPLQAPRLRR